MTTDANTGSGTSNGTVFLMDTTMPTGTDDSTVSFSVESNCVSEISGKISMLFFTGIFFLYNSKTTSSNIGFYITYHFKL